jgi:hypothetical protein
MSNYNVKFDTIQEAWFAASTEAEGYNSSLRIPIFKNEDGTFEIGSAQNQAWKDFGVEEVGDVSGWNIDDVCDSTDEKKERVNTFLLLNKSELFYLFKESFEY